MASEKKIIANRLNALSSTGPKTAKGKMTASKNALSHGLRSESPVLPAIENDEDWERHLQTFITATRAREPVEVILATKAASALWRQARIVSFQTELAAMQMEARIESFQKEYVLPEVSPDECPDLNSVLWKYENDFAHVPEVQALFDQAFRAAMPLGKASDLLLRYNNSYDREFFRSYSLLVKIRDARESASGPALAPSAERRQRARVDRIKAKLTQEVAERLMSLNDMDKPTRIALDEWFTEREKLELAAKPEPKAELESKPEPEAEPAAACKPAAQPVPEVMMASAAEPAGPTHANAEPISIATAAPAKLPNLPIAAMEALPTPSSEPARDPLPRQSSVRSQAKPAEQPALTPAVQRSQAEPGPQTALPESLASFGNLTLTDVAKGTYDKSFDLEATDAEIEKLLRAAHPEWFAEVPSLLERIASRPPSTHTSPQRSPESGIMPQALLHPS